MNGEDVILTESEKTNKVSGKFLFAITTFSKFIKGESYWLEYLGDDMYCGRSDNILNEKIKISPYQLYYYFSENKPTAFEKCLSDWFYTVRNCQPIYSEFESNENFCDRNAIQAAKMLMDYITTDDLKKYNII